MVCQQCCPEFCIFAIRCRESWVDNAAQTGEWSFCLSMVGGLLGAWAKLRKATVSFAMSAVRQHRTGIPLDRFSWNLMCIFRKSVEKTQVSLKSDKKNGYFTWRRFYVYDNNSLNSSWNEKCFTQNFHRKSKRILPLFPHYVLPYVGHVNCLMLT
jgi:hypothetical protein